MFNYSRIRIGIKTNTMKFTRELTNGILIFIGIGIYFIVLEFAGLSDQFLLRIVNVAFVAFGVNRTIKGNYEDGLRGYNKNLISAIITSLIGAVLSIGSLLSYIQIQGGEPYLKRLSENFIFGGGELTIQQYCIGLFFEATAASLIVSFCLMQYWKNKVEVINKVD